MQLWDLWQRAFTDRTMPPRMGLELRRMKDFNIVTDHQNLKCSTTTGRLSEWQMRWADILTRFNFTIAYRRGRLDVRPDALTRQEQDLPQSEQDKRLEFRSAQLLSPKLFEPAEQDKITTAATQSNLQSSTPTDVSLKGRSFIIDSSNGSANIA